MAEMFSEYWSSSDCLHSELKGDQIILSWKVGPTPCSLNILCAKVEEEDQKRAPPHRTRQVTDIFTWIQCFASYVSVLAGRFADCIPEIMAYLVTITWVSQDLRFSLSEVRCLLSSPGSNYRKWSQINPTLYSLCFTACVVTVKRCELCRAHYKTNRLDV